MFDVNKAIYACDDVICRNIESFTTEQRGLLSQNILSQLRNFVENIFVKVYISLGGEPQRKDYDTIRVACSYVKALQGEYRFLSQFHKLLQISVSHYTLDPDSSERLMLKYYEYLLRIRILMKEKFGMKLLANLSQFPLNTDKTFTLNYDTLFEQAARKGNYTIIDGFSFSIPRIFSGRHFDYDIVIRDGSRIKNEDNFVPRVFHLYKPHGSVDWEKRGNNVYQNRAEEISVENSLMIFPQENKYEHSYEQPFFEMMTRFQAALRMKNTTLVVIGFSFGDKHILSMINEALEQNPSFQLIIVNYRDTGIMESDMFDAVCVHR